ncbi:MAG: hypothetical protein LBL58_06645 [Tannerellaceae bacterium]|jgi:hypothetical protein|nr:hypothetical protein [Tannerellaceae bacterium]
MKNLIVLFLFMGFMACDSVSDMKTETVTKEQVKDTISVPEQEPVDEGKVIGVVFANLNVSILFTDSYNVSVFDPKRGKRWKKEDIQVSYVIPGKEDRPSYSYVEGYIPYEGDLKYIDFVSRLLPIDNPENEKPWLSVVCAIILNESEFNTTFLTFPDGSVDTIVSRRYTPVTYQAGLKEVWYNSEQVLSWDLYSNEPLGTYPDGSVIHKGGEFHIVKK